MGKRVKNQYNPIALVWDGIKGHVNSTDRFGNSLSGFESSMKIVSAVPITKATSIVTSSATRSLSVGAGTKMAAKGVPSHFGQIRGGIKKTQELTKSNHNLKLLDGKRIDLKGRHPLSKGHYNKVTKEQLGYPHVYDPTHPGGVRAPNANDYIEIFNFFK